MRCLCLCLRFWLKSGIKLKQILYSFEFRRLCFLTFPHNSSDKISSLQYLENKLRLSVFVRNPNWLPLEESVSIHSKEFKRINRSTRKKVGWVYQIRTKCYHLHLSSSSCKFAFIERKNYDRKNDSCQLAAWSTCHKAYLNCTHCMPTSCTCCLL